MIAETVPGALQPLLVVVLGKKELDAESVRPILGPGFLRDPPGPGPPRVAAFAAGGKLDWPGATGSIPSPPPRVAEAEDRRFCTCRKWVSSSVHRMSSGRRIAERAADAAVVAVYAL